VAKTSPSSVTRLASRRASARSSLASTSEYSLSLVPSMPSPKYASSFPLPAPAFKLSFSRHIP
jgi:hypothetical protein